MALSRLRFWLSNVFVFGRTGLKWGGLMKLFILEWCWSCMAAEESRGGLNEKCFLRAEHQGVAISFAEGCAIDAACVFGSVLN